MMSSTASSTGFRTEYSTWLPTKDAMRKASFQPESLLYALMLEDILEERQGPRIA
jgi:hypothetical protein